MYFTHRATTSVGIAFIIMSLVFGTWITRIPDIKLQTGISEGELGLALLGMPIGAIFMMMFMGSLIHRFGAGRITFVSSIAYVLSLIPPAFCSGLATLTISLVFVGLSAGAMDVAMNAAAASIEKQYKKRIMSTSHALFSFGGMIGAGMGSLVVGFGVSTAVHFITVTMLLLLLIGVFRQAWMGISDKKEGAHKWAWPTRSLALLALVGFCAMLSEGAIADWSAIFIRDTLDGSPFLGGLGFAGFSLTMALGRFYGDILIPRVGAGIIVRGGGIFAALVLGLAIAVKIPVVAIIGFTLAGFGLSCIVPIVFSTAASTPGISPGGGIASVSSMGYLGFMVGPPSIGFVAEEFGLVYGFGVVAAMCLLFGLLGGSIGAAKKN